MATSVVRSETEATPQDDVLESWMHLGEDDDVLPTSTTQRRTPTRRRRGRPMDLDEVLKNRQKRSKSACSVAKWRRLRSGSSGSDDDHFSDKEDEFKQKQDGLEKLLEDLLPGGDIEKPQKWGEQIFGRQKDFPECPESGRLIQAALKLIPTNEEDSTAAIGPSSVLLRSQVIFEGRCSAITAHWIYHQMAYSKNEGMVKQMCTVFCDLLTQKTRDGEPFCKFEWLPTLEDIMETLHIYGYMDFCQETKDEKYSEQMESNLQCPEEGNPCAPTASHSLWGPPPNIQSLLQFLTIYARSRKWHCKLSVPEAESLVITVIRCQLDRCMLTSAHLLRSCLEALTHYFTDEEWAESCERIASPISRASPSFVNNLHSVKSLRAPDNRVRTLQRLTVPHLLSRLLDAKSDLSRPEDVVSIFKAVNVEDKDFKFWNIYYLLTLADLYLSNLSTGLTSNVRAEWLDVLKKVSKPSRISSNDARADAMKVRNFASFLIHKYEVAKTDTASSIF